MRRHRRHRKFRNMRVLRHEPRDAAEPEARAEPVDQMRQLLGVVAAGKPGLGAVAALGHQRREPDHVVAEARIAGVAQHRKPLLEQLAHPRADRAAASRCRSRAGAPCRRRETARPETAVRPRRAAPAPRPAVRAVARWCRARPPRARSDRESAARPSRPAPADAAGSARRHGRAPDRADASAPSPKRAANGARGREARSADGARAPRSSGPPRFRRRCAAPRPAAAACGFACRRAARTDPRARP